MDRPKQQIISSGLGGQGVAAACLGVDVKWSKVKIFVLSAVFASVAGSLYAHYFVYVNPDAFSVFKSVDLVIMVVVGGRAPSGAPSSGVALI